MKKTFCFVSAFRVAVFAAMVVLAAGGAVAQTNLRIVAANITSGNNQKYESPGTNILKALDPDVVLIQEFNVPGANDTAAVNAWVSSTFGAGYSWFRETGASIPNGVISKYPILDSGEWNDTAVGDRDFVWAQIDIPGSVDLYAVSLHLWSGGGSSGRNTQAQALVNTYLPTLGMPVGSYLVIGGDMNTDGRGESCITTLGAFVNASSPYPVGEDGDSDTNANRNKPYDWVIPNTALRSLATTTTIGSFSYTNGLVFDSRDYTQPQLNASFSPVLVADSGATNMQHMAVVRDFTIPAGSSTTGGESVSVSTTNRAPATAAPGSTVSMLSIALSTTGAEWDANSVTLNRLGTLADANVTFRIYNDLDADGVQDAGEALLGSATPSSGTATITLSPKPRAQSGSPVNLLVSAVVGAGAPDASTLEAQLAANGVAHASSGGADLDSTNAAASSTSTTIVVPPASTSGVVVNKYANASPDAVELLIVADNTNLQGMILKDFSSSMANDGGGKYTFASNALWANMRAGTLVILRNDSSAADTTTGTGSDFLVDVGLQNTTYFGTPTGTFDIAGTEMVMIKASGSALADETGSIHILASGTATSRYTNAAAPKLRGTATTGTGTFAIADNPDSLLSDFTDATGTATGGATGVAFGSGNNASNTAFITFLRGPASQAATNLDTTSFRANWNALTTATGYRLDVATDSNFASPVPGFNNLDTGNVLFADVSGLSPNTTYYFRVRGANSEGTLSTNSPVVTASTLAADTTAPTVQSIVRQTPPTGTTASQNLTWRATFSEAVTSVDTGDFAATVTSGSTTGASVTLVAEVGASVYDVTVDRGSGDGVLRLDVLGASAFITDAALNPLTLDYTAGESYTINAPASVVDWMLIAE